jgi:hypothetical protein
MAIEARAVFDSVCRGSAPSTKSEAVTIGRFWLVLLLVAVRGEKLSERKRTLRDINVDIAVLRPREK